MANRSRRFRWRSWRRTRRPGSRFRSCSKGFLFKAKANKKGDFMRVSKINLVESFLAVAFVVSGLAQNFARMAMVGGENAEAKATLTINADGSAKFVQESTQSRQLAEQTVRMMEQYRNRGEGDDAEESVTAAKPAEKAELKPLTDEELEKKLRESGENAEEEFGVQRGKLENLKVEKDRIRMTTA